MHAHQSCAVSIRIASRFGVDVTPHWLQVPLPGIAAVGSTHTTTLRASEARKLLQQYEVPPCPEGDCSLVCDECQLITHNIAVRAMLHVWHHSLVCAAYFKLKTFSLLLCHAYHQASTLMWVHALQYITVIVDLSESVAIHACITRSSCSLHCKDVAYLGT